jgi:tetratricopeptide (TPR) repeat protein
MTFMRFQTNDPVERNQLINESLRSYAKAIEIYPKFTSAYNNLGSVYVNMKGDHVSAIPYFRKALELDPLYLQAKANLAYCYQKTGKTKEAEMMYQEVITKDTGRYLNAFYNLGELYFSQGRFDEAIAINKKAANIFSKADLPWVTIGNYYLLKGDTAEAVKNWQKALEIYPFNENLSRNLSLYFLAHKDPEKANYYRRLAENASLRR